MAESRVTSIAAEIFVIMASQARVTSVAAELLATAASQARVSAMARGGLGVSRRGAWRAYLVPEHRHRHGSGRMIAMLMLQHDIAGTLGNGLRLHRRHL